MQTAAAFGLYPSSRLLHNGAEALRAARFRQTDISVMYSDGVQALRLRERDRENADVVDDDDEPCTLGGLLSALSGIGAIATRDAGPYMAGGPILATLADSGAGLLDALRDLGMPDGDVPRVEVRLRQGGLLLLVQCDDDEWVHRAQSILRETGAEHVAATTQSVTFS